MKLQFENDSWISKVIYDTTTKEMHVTAYGKVYTCVNVEKEVFDAFYAAPSKGKYFNAHIKGKFQHEYFQ